jgi:hypothetical protein
VNDPRSNSSSKLDPRLEPERGCDKLSYLRGDFTGRVDHLVSYYGYELRSDGSGLWDEVLFSGDSIQCGRDGERLQQRGELDSCATDTYAYADSGAHSHPNADSGTNSRRRAGSSQRMVQIGE